MYKHLFFDMDQTIAPSRELILPDMYQLLTKLTEEVIIVSGQDVEKIKWQSNNLPAIILGQNGNHAVNKEDKELWRIPLAENYRQEILEHIKKISALVTHEIKEEWVPIEDRGSQITFSPIGNQAPVVVKKNYDPERKIREGLLKEIPFVSDDLVVKIGGSTSLDYIHKNRHKGTNVQKLIDEKKWSNDDCVYFGDGLYPGGNDEAVIGVIDTIAVEDHIDTYNKLVAMFDEKS